MIVRYGINNSGKKTKLAKIWTATEHKIDNSKISKRALGIISFLNKNGFKAYLVGGSVRDLIIGTTPKDFDIVTDAKPSTVRALFKNSRIIGRRFKLVHIFFEDKYTIEVATFRARNSENFLNVYGTIVEDAQRRDFSINALYYDPENRWVIDYVDGFQDLKKGVVKNLIPISNIFIEDPVRIIRAVKYANICNFSIEKKLQKKIFESSGLILNVSKSRLVEEFIKILQSGKSYNIFNDFIKFKIFQFFLPNYDMKYINDNFFSNLKELDNFIEKSKNRYTRSLGFEYFIENTISNYDASISYNQNFKETFSYIRSLFSPLPIIKVDLELAIKSIFKTKFKKSQKKKKEL